MLGSTTGQNSIKSSVCKIESSVLFEIRHIRSGPAISETLKSKLIRKFSSRSTPGQGLMWPQFFEKHFASENNWFIVKTVQDCVSNSALCIN